MVSLRLLLCLSGAFLLLMEVGKDLRVACLETTTTTISLEHEPIVIIEDQEMKKTKKSESLRYTKSAPAKSTKESNVDMKNSDSIRYTKSSPAKNTNESSVDGSNATKKSTTTQTEKTFWIPEGELGLILSNATATKRLLNLSRDTYEQNIQPKDNIPLKSVMRSLKEKIKEAEEEKAKKISSKKSELVTNEKNENEKKENVAKIIEDNKDAPEKIGDNEKESITKDASTNEKKENVAKIDGDNKDTPEKIVNNEKDFMTKDSSTEGKTADDNKPERVGVSETESINKDKNETKADSEKAEEVNTKMNITNEMADEKKVVEAPADKKTIISEEPVITQTPVIKITEDNPSKKSMPEEPIIAITGDTKETMAEEPVITQIPASKKSLPEEPLISQSPAAKKFLPEEPVITQNIPEESVSSQTPVIKISPEEPAITQTIASKKSLPKKPVISQTPLIKISPEEPNIVQTTGSKKSLAEEPSITKSPAHKKSQTEEALITQTPVAKKTIEEEPVITLLGEKSELDKTNAHIKNAKLKSSIDRENDRTTKTTKTSDNLDDSNGTKKQAIGLDLGDVDFGKKTSRKTDIQTVLQESTVVTEDSLHKAGQLPMLDNPKLESLSKNINGYPADSLESANLIETPPNEHKPVHDDEDSTVRAEVPTTLAQQIVISNSSQNTSTQGELTQKSNTTIASTNSSNNFATENDLSGTSSANMATLMEINNGNKSSSTPTFTPLQGMNTDVTKNNTNATVNLTDESDNVDKSSTVFDLPSKKPVMTTKGLARDKVTTVGSIIRPSPTSKLKENDKNDNEVAKNESLAPTNKVISMMGPTAFSFNEISQQNDDLATAVPTASFQIKSSISNVTALNNTMESRGNIKDNNETTTLNTSTGGEESKLINSPTSSSLLSAPTSPNNELGMNSNTTSTDMASNVDVQNESALRSPTSPATTATKNINTSNDVSKMSEKSDETNQSVEQLVKAATEEISGKGDTAPIGSTKSDKTTNDLDNKTELKHEISTNSTTQPTNNIELNNMDLNKLFSPKEGALNNTTNVDKPSDTKSNTPDTPIINDVVLNTTETVENTTTASITKAPFHPLPAVNPITDKSFPVNPIAANIPDDESQPIISPEEKIPTETTNLVDDAAAKVPTYGAGGFLPHMPIQGPSAYPPINAHDITTSYLPTIRKYVNLEKVGSIPAEETLGVQTSKYPYLDTTLDVVNNNADMLTKQNILTARTGILPNTLIPKQPAIDSSLKKSKTPKGSQIKKITPKIEPKKLSAVSSSTIKELTQSLKRKILDVWPYPKYIKSPADAMLDQGLINRAKMHLSSGKRLENLFKRAVHGEDIRVAYISSSIYRKQAIDSQKAHLLLYNQALSYWFSKVITPITGSNLIQEKVEIPDVKEDYFSRCLENHLPHSDDINLIIWELPELRKKSGGKLSPSIGEFTETVLRSALSFASHPEIIMVDFYRGRGLGKADYCSQLNQDVEMKLANRYDNTLLSWSKSICPYLKDDEEGFSYSYLFSGDKDHPSIIGHAQMAYILADFLRDEFLRFLSEHSTKNMKYKDFKIKTPDIPSKSLFTKIERPLCYTSLRSLGNTQDASNVPLELRFIKPKDKNSAESVENANARSSISPSLVNKKVHSVMLRFTIPGHANVTNPTTLGILPYVSKPALTVARVDNQPFFKLNVSKITRGEILELQPTTLLTGGDHLIRFYSLDKRFNILAFTVDEKKKGVD